MGDPAPSSPGTARTSRASTWWSPARWAVALAAYAGMLVWAAARSPYGFHRDELYFLACGRRPAWGYPDQPPLTPLVARATELVWPHSTVALRLPAVAVAVGTTVLAALLARDLGGGRAARALAALAVGSGTAVVGGGRMLVTFTLDLAVWVGLTWIAVRLLRTGDRRWWVAFGALLGVGLTNKQLPLLLAAGFVAGVLVTRPARPLLRGPWPWVGAAVAAVCWTPVLVWQARHGWPQLTLAGQIRQEYGAPDKRVQVLVGQALLYSLGATVLWVTGLRALLRRPALAPFRPLAVAWIVALGLFVLTAGQLYYLAGLYPVLVAAGAVVAEGWRRRRAVAALVVASALLTAPAVLPVLAPATLGASPWSELGETQREMVGWPGLVDQVAAAWRTIPEAERGRAVVFTANYGEAGAVEEYGPARGLPAVAYSGHNGFGDWGPPPVDDGPVVVVHESDPPGAPPPATFFTGCRAAGRVVTGVPDEEGDYASVWTCTGPVGGWRALWPRLVHLSA